MKTSKSRLVFVTLLALTLCYGGQASRAADTSDGLVIERRIYAFPSYEKAVRTTDVKKYYSRGAYEQAVSDRNFELLKLKYMSDGLELSSKVVYERMKEVAYS